jgi:hypothetical protein
MAKARSGSHPPAIRAQRECSKNRE